MIQIIDYGMGNLRSVQKALEHVGAEAVIVRTPDTLDRADKVILPGVGAFADAIANLRSGGFVEPIKAFIESGKPFLGICLGLQLLFDSSEEDGLHEGMGVLPGRVVRFQPGDHALKVPHMGWNGLRFDPARGDAMLHGLTPGCAVYFVHSYFAVPSDPAVVATTTDYGGEFCSSVRRGNIFACQFHPEKSQAVGLTMLKNFASL